MKKNIGNTDRLLRVIVATVFAALYFTDTITGIFGTVLLVLAVAFVLTSLVKYCPLYSLMDVNTG